MEGSPARIFPWQAAERAWKDSGAGYFSRSLGSAAKYDPGSFSWRTSQRLLFEDQNELLENFAASGMTVDGEFFPLRMWARITDAKDGGFWRTPDTGAGGTSGLLKKGKTKRKSGAAITMRLVYQVNNPWMWPTPRAGKTSSENPEVWAKRQKDGKVATPPLGMAVKMFPTPRAGERGQYQRDRGIKGKERATLTGIAKMWPTPTAQDAKNNAGPSQWDRNTDPLNVAVKKWPTPTARAGQQPGKHGQGGQNLATATGGSLNPMWVEWLMGYLCGWTALEDWAMQWFRPKRGKRSSVFAV
jgi:hypothetical protein